MWRRSTIAAVALAGLLCRPAAGADTPAATPILAQMARNGYVRFNVTSGRITLSGRRHGNISSTSSSGGRSEKLRMQVSDGKPSLSYQRTDSKERLSIEIDGAGGIHISRSGLEDSSIVPLEFSQDPGEPMTLTLGAEGRRERHRAAGLWHLLITRRRQCREHLVPVLELLRENWQLAQTGDAIEAALLRMAAAGATPDHRQWAALVEQLADDRFSKRQAADRRLRAAGETVLGFLYQLDFARLHAEQQIRVRRIIRALSRQTGDDEPEAVARRLLADQTVWLALLGREDESTRKAAARQLSALLGEPIQFDPDAEAEVRDGQIEKIQAHFTKPRPLVAPPK